MPKNKSIAFMLLGETGSDNSAFTDDKYKDLAAAFCECGCKITSVIYNDDLAKKLQGELQTYDAVLVWINPIQHGKNRKVLDGMLIELAKTGTLVSTHPSVIKKMGTKEILYTTRDMDWGGDINLFSTYDDFKNRFIDCLQKSGPRVLKQYRGMGGIGVYKIEYIKSKNEISVIHARGQNNKQVYSKEDFYNAFEQYFQEDGKLIDQKWNDNLVNGVVRTYLSGSKVVGFGYQEINALFNYTSQAKPEKIPNSKRYYYTENCGLFQDLKKIMENKWVPELHKRFSIQDVQEKRMPILWDADFFINDPYEKDITQKYSLCETNVSCVSPFPPSAIPHIINETLRRI